MGIVEVVALAAKVAGVPLGTAITLTRRRIENPNYWHRRLLRARRARPGSGLFLGYLLGKNIGGVIAIISFCPGRWMQQSAVPRGAILSVGSTGGIGQ
jgi:hypothetical protein